MSVADNIGAFLSEFCYGIAAMGRGGKDDAIGRLVSSARSLKRFNLSPLQEEIIGQLMGGRRTLAEMAAAIFGVTRRDESFDACYSRLRRAVSGLEKAGVVSRGGLLGRGKPYHLSQYGVAELASISPGMDKPGLISVGDLLVFAMAPVAALGCFVLSTRGGVFFLVAFFLFSYLLGVASARSVSIFRKVM